MIFRKNCILCSIKHHDPHAVCHPCIQRLPQLSMLCRSCATPLPTTHPPYCFNCLRAPRPVSCVHVLYPFVAPLQQLIHLFKYQQGLYLTSFLSLLILHALPPHAKRPTLLVPVPLHRSRLHERGFNQSYLLARTLSRWLTIPMQSRCCEKIMATPAQATLSTSQRRANLSLCFRTTPIAHQHIALIDDVYTSGATVEAIASQFKKQGVSTIEVWCIARTLKQWKF